MSPFRQGALRARFQRWSDHSRQVTNIRLISIAAAIVMITLSGTTLVTSAAQVSLGPQPQDPLPTPAFGVAGTGQAGICAEILGDVNDPPKIADCRRLVLFRDNFDLDYLDVAPRSADLLIANGTLRAGKLSHFRVLRLNDRPSFRQCLLSAAAKQFWISFKDLPGRTVCVRSDEGRTGIVQAETVNARHTRVEARLTMWEQS